MEDAVRAQSPQHLVSAVQAAVIAGKNNFRAVQQRLAPLLFGPAALLTPAQSLELLLGCLSCCTAPQESQPSPGPALSEQQSRGTSSTAAVAHLLIELIPSPTKAAGDAAVLEPHVRTLAAAAAQLLELQCLNAGTARLAVKLAQQFRLTMEDLTNKQAVIDFVGALLSDSSTFSPAIALMMLLEVGRH